MTRKQVRELSSGDWWDYSYNMCSASIRKDWLTHLDSNIRGLGQVSFSNDVQWDSSLLLTHRVLRLRQLQGGPAEFKSVKTRSMKTTVQIQDAVKTSVLMMLLLRVRGPSVSQRIGHFELQAVWERLPVRVDDVHNSSLVQLHLRETLRHKTTCKSKQNLFF